LGEIEELQKKVAEVEVTKDTLEAIWEVKHTMAQGGFSVDDRKLVWLATKVARAEAVYNGSNITEVEHLFPLQHCLWDRPEDRATIRQIVLSIVNPTAEECATYLDSANQIWKQFETVVAEAGDNKRSVTTHAIDSSTEVAEILTSLEKRIGEAGNGSQSQLQETQIKVSKIQKKILASMGAGLGINLGLEQ